MNTNDIKKHLDKIRYAIDDIGRILGGDATPFRKNRSETHHLEGVVSDIYFGTTKTGKSFIKFSIEDCKCADWNYNGYAIKDGDQISCDVNEREYMGKIEYKIVQSSALKINGVSYPNIVPTEVDNTEDVPF